MIRTLKKMLILVLVLLLLPIYTLHSFAQEAPNIEIEDLTAEAGDSVKLQVWLSANTGICGATISITYGKELVLTAIDKGTALSSLTMTKPGKLTANPIRITWDGLEQDETNGVLVTLTFIVPETPGEYDVCVSYDSGDIVDGDLKPLNVSTKNGKITVKNKELDNTAILEIGKAEVSPRETVQIPINVSGMMEICGATISIMYDNNLVLSDINQGEAWSSLTMTKPGNYSANPIKITWDGLEADSTTGTIAFLTFIAPQQPGTYYVNASYTDGDIVDGDLKPVNISIKQGQITVKTSESIVVEIAGEKITMCNNSDADVDIIVAFYNSAGAMLSVKIYPNAEGEIKVNNTSASAFAKVMMWESGNTMRPICKAQRISLIK